MKSLKLANFRVVSASLALLATVAAQADVKIVSHMHGTVMGRALPEQSLSTYYKGDMMRTEMLNTVTIVDAKANKVYVLHPNDKTYNEMDGKDMPPTMQGMKVDATAQVTPTSDHKTVAGHDAAKYAVNMHMSISGNGQPATPMDMIIDVWTASDLKTPFVPMQLVRSMGQFMRGMNFTGYDEVVSEMSKIKGFPLQQTITMNTMPGMPTGMGNGSGPMAVVEISADSVSEAPLGDDLFKVPDGYTKVDKGATGH